MTIDVIDYVLNDIWKHCGTRWPRIWERHRIESLDSSASNLDRSHFCHPDVFGTVSLEEQEPLMVTFTVGHAILHVTTYGFEYPKSYDASTVSFRHTVPSLWDYAVREKHIAVLRVAAGICSECGIGLWDGKLYIKRSPVLASRQNNYPQMRGQSCQKLLSWRDVIHQLEYTLGDTRGRWLGQR